MHGDFKTESVYANGVKLTISGAYPNGIKFYGPEGWLFVSRGDEAVTASDPAGTVKGKKLAASNPKILDSVIGPDEIHLYVSKEHHGNWLECIIPVNNQSHRSRSAPFLFHVPGPSHRDEGEP